MTEQQLVVVVDDNRTIRLMTRKLLEEVGFNVVEADNGEQAMEIIPKLHPDAILLDIEMPGVNGFAVCKELRKLPEFRYTPIMMVTRHDDPESISKAFEAGATEFTVKPINWDILGYRVRYMIRNSKFFFELQESQAQLRKAREELEQRVIERTHQLNKTTEELKTTLNSLRTTQSQLIESEKTSILADLLNGIAREVHTPIDLSIDTAISLKNNLDTIKGEFDQNSLKRSDMENYLKLSGNSIDSIQKNLSRSSELIKSFKQLSVEKTTEVSSNVRLKEYLEEVIFGLDPILKKSKVTITIHCPDDLIIFTYPGILFHIIMTLVTNSLTHGYGPDESGTITLDVSQEKDAVVLRYSDTGKGIPEHSISKLFEPFFTTKSDADTNAGLGLYIVHNRVTGILGGTISCASKMGEGTTFTISLPKSEKQA